MADTDPDAHTRVRCATCFREERWDGATVKVLQPGGARRPAVPAPLAAWDALRAGHAAGKLARGRCRCGQPLLDDGEAGHPPIGWSIPLPDGDTLELPPGLEGVDLDTTTAYLERLYPRRSRQPPHLVLFQLATLTPVVAGIIGAWLLAAITLTMFLRAFASLGP